MNDKVRNIKKMLPKYRQIVSVALNKNVVNLRPTEESLEDGAPVTIEFTVFSDTNEIDEAGSALATSVLANYPYDGEETATAVIVKKIRDAN